MMDRNLRLAALSSLVSDLSPAVEAKLLAEMDRVEGVLNASNEYDDLAAALKVLTVLASRFSFRVLPMLTAFVRSVPDRVLTWNGEPIIASQRKYRSADQLIREAVDVPRSIRCVHIDALLGSCCAACGPATALLMRWSWRNDGWPTGQSLRRLRSR